MRKTKIICTLGPSSDSDKVIRELILSGMNVARFNFSHGTHEEQEAKFRTLRSVRIALHMPIASMLDTKGPEIRLKTFKNHRVDLKRGDLFTLTSREVEGDEHIVSITEPSLPSDVKEGCTILADDGLIGLKVVHVTDTDIECRVENSGALSDRKSINIPDVELSMPFISEQDKRDIEFGCRLGFDYIACSFTRCAEDIRAVRRILDEHHSKMKVIAKIESMQGVRNLDEILEVADGVMVARGDLGVEVPFEEVPALQKEIIRKCQEKGRIVITATQMLDSMIHNPRPTRAEVADVANAIYDGTTAIMLSGETAAGAYPVEAVKTMARIAERAEKDVDYHMFRHNLLEHASLSQDVTTATCHAAITLAEESGAKAMIAVTLSGYSAEQIARLRSSVPIIACSTSTRVACQMNLLFGVQPLIINEEEDMDVLFRSAIDRAKMAGLIGEGSLVVLVAGVPLGHSGHTNLIHCITA